MARSEKLLEHEAFRCRVNEIILEYTNSTNFIKKVRSYAGEEIESRQFSFRKRWAWLIASNSIGALIGGFVGRLIK